MTAVLRVAGVVLIVAATDPLFELLRARRLRGGAQHVTVHRRRLAKRLDNARITATPLRWNHAQMLGGMPVLTALVIAGEPPALAVGTALSMTRIVCALFLWTRRNRLADELEQCASALARCVAAEMRDGRGGGSALERAATAQLALANDELRRLLTTVASRIALGDDAGAALSVAVEETQRRLHRPLPPLAAVGSLLTVHLKSGMDRGGALVRLADALDADRRSRNEARALLTETRVSAFAVPLVTAGVMAMLLNTDHAAGTAVVTMPGLAAVAVLALVCGAGVSIVARLTT